MSVTENTSPWISVSSEGDFDRLLEQSRVPLLVDFWASWCAPCRALMPLLEKLATELQGQILLLKVNADEQPELAARYAVRSLPTVKLFRDGQVADEFMGALPEGQIRAFLDPYIDHEYDRLLALAQQDLDAGEYAAGLEKLRQAVALAPAEARVVLSLLNALLQRAQSAPAQAEDCLAEADSLIEQSQLALQRDPGFIQACSRLHLLRAGQGGDDPQELRQAAEQGDAGAAVRLAGQLASSGQEAAALQFLLDLLQPGKLSGEAKDRVRKSLIDLLNTLPDREMANHYRRRLFALLH